MIGRDQQDLPDALDVTKRATRAELQNMILLLMKGEPLKRSVASTDELGSERASAAIMGREEEEQKEEEVPQHLAALMNQLKIESKQRNEPKLVSRIPGSLVLKHSPYAKDGGIDDAF